MVNFLVKKFSPFFIYYYQKYSNNKNQSKQLFKEVTAYKIMLK
ncbi:hypothetical protein DBQ04_04485 [Lactobacillus acidophilus]|uniref:Uncharacterized protein n=1 Tax=Lactobacillus acidophilus (strain ATCC 700396 / NCK56 / N2 / NCFM) TaxID=272621 RepID=Q5FMM5_LACAC|nr:hypothetical protein LBA0148 [Lactobacillus acidophilus NCFM]AZN75801.1 hypothetical protein CXB72_00860 [Lactobacillus acidophilus]KAB1966156.1 hypothetical protein F8247_04490 [Lactobacillus acidophilus]MBO8211755.1 hypothetical protein [Lactobacillus acidophilus]MCT3593957.1 hypothetical protein [Lactobacillus acidophilus]